jgi:hypothetical protein
MGEVFESALPFGRGRGGARTPPEPANPKRDNRIWVKRRILRDRVLGVTIPEPAKQEYYINR